jgi:hypothetical protein
MAKSVSQPGFASQNAPKMRKVIVVLLALGVAGSVASLVVHAPPPQDAILAHASARDVGQPATGAATAAAAKSSAPVGTGAPPDFDYFPNRYVNQATKIEEPSPTF